jgi:hypothetical protein
MEACVRSPKSRVRTYSHLSILISQPTTETLGNPNLGAVKFVEIIQLPYSQAVSSILTKEEFMHCWNKELSKGLTALWGLR